MTMTTPAPVRIHVSAETVADWLVPDPTPTVDVAALCALEEWQLLGVAMATAEFHEKDLRRLARGDAPREGD